MRVQVDPERCQGHTLCAMIAPDSFRLSDVDGTSSAVSEVVPVDQQEAVQEAARSCPEQAITITHVPSLETAP
ncbi:ferredoxin [Mycobacterium sp. B14F4]|uniref:ferredoxin n=1 Tax=Mycobacterium sp. B14F4 TaxID=3153565 RepID=UPI00325DF88B